MRRLRQAFKANGIVPDNSFELESVFRTQTNFAYNAGAWTAAQDPVINEILWGFKYVTVGDDRVRDEHFGLDGTTAPKDNSTWDSIWPPNGWSCRCQTLFIFDERKTQLPPQQIEVDGRIVDVGPDKGFGFNPGKVLDKVGGSPRIVKEVGKKVRRVPLPKRIPKAKKPISEPGVGTSADIRKEYITEIDDLEDRVATLKAQEKIVGKEWEVYRKDLADKGIDHLEITASAKYKEFDKKFWDLKNEREALSKSKVDRLLSKIKQTDNAKITPRVSQASKNIEKRINKQVDELNKYLHKNVSKYADGRIDIDIISTKIERSQYKGGTIELGKGTKNHILYHEMGHHLEEDNIAISRLVRDFRSKRTKGDELKNLSDVVKNITFDDWEKCKPDKFIDPYMGKFYNGKGTEITSSGLELMFKDPVLFARRDPEYFELILDIMGGRF